MHKTELLAPAGDWESFVAAVENGADAVYLGGKLFSARSSAANFDNQALSRAVEYAHVRGVKVYVTVNTLLADQEITEAMEFLYFLYTAGADAVIIQDLGLSELARLVLPELPLHASTQMTVHNLPAVELLLEAGFERVVLAREMSLSSIDNIKKRTGADLEIFIHGALCICYSGQCLMSSIIGGRSGNRGRCAQPCRMRYELVDEAGRPMLDQAKTGDYLLSPRDLNLSEHIPQLIRAGILSFKVEGRMKRPEYVATVIRIYRGLIDRADGQEYHVSEEETRKLTQIFNRDFSAGYFFGHPGHDLMSYKRPNNRGVKLGRVKQYDRGEKVATLILDEPLRVGDGVEIWVTDGGRLGIEIDTLLMAGKKVERAPAGSQVQIFLPRKVGIGDRVFKTHDADLIEKARATFTSQRERTKIALQFFVRAREGEPLYLQAVEPSGQSAEAATGTVGQKAENRPLDREFLLKQLGRLGNSPFGLAGLSCDIDGSIIYPVKEINEARRQVLEELKQNRIKAGSKIPVPENVYQERLEGALLGTGAEHRRSDVHISEPGISVTVTDLASLQEAVRSGARLVYFGGESFRSKKNLSIDDIYHGLDYCRANNVLFVLSSPRILQDEELSRFAKLLKQTSEWPLDGIQVGNLGLLKYVRENTGKPVYTDFSFNIFNHQAVHFLLKQGVRHITLSPELTMGQLHYLKTAVDFDAEILVHGALPLMVSRYCVLGSLLGGKSTQTNCSGPCSGKRCGLRDRMAITFPVEVDYYCNMHIFNSRDHCLLEDLSQISSMNISLLRIEARREDAKYVKKVVSTYREALNSVTKGKLRDFTAAKEALAALVPGGLTKGHYYRGVIGG
ncbi:peptidase U32 [Desulfofarcimen acetoxidans DSM 771]|uniref:Peptidase U32 n=1 Tax=Desulfofarcimen acetoxidans (strain ATCC 49208 / DSM 771 / KCTC 5769 / VKM B-1644 / 5575) TaxID=485916 RepID=C8W0E7_DESAS|nr:DUF3656 domain-containing protein [Desulfofarcimen acetoxidans]ACV63202.1 peptidase U32 [Desulfofarcimen acetoxidans DSM 771]